MPTFYNLSFSASYESLLPPIGTTIDFYVRARVWVGVQPNPTGAIDPLLYPSPNDFPNFFSSFPPIFLRLIFAFRSSSEMPAIEHGYYYILPIMLTEVQY